MILFKNQMFQCCSSNNVYPLERWTPQLRYDTNSNLTLSPTLLG